MTTRTHKLHDAFYAKFREFIADYTGLHFPEKKRADLERGVLEALAKSSCPNIEEYYDTLARNPGNGEMDRLVSLLTVGETYFYRDESQFKLLDEAVRVFGKGKVSTHLIVGLGETEKEMIRVIQECVDMGVLPALFAFTPISGTRLENHSQPQIEGYRRIQIARYLMLNGISRFENMRFDSQDRVDNFGIRKNAFMRIVRTEAPFRTSGCPDCNRPYYNEKPSGPLYNYPKRISHEDLSEIERQLGVGELCL